jgi:hypothetical protein
MTTILTPCMICEKAVTTTPLPEGYDDVILNSAARVNIRGWYGSEFDCMEYEAIICDECLSTAVQARRVTFVKEHGPFSP